MTDEESIMKETEQIINDASERRHLDQIKEHQAMMPYLVSYANDIIAQKGTDPNGVHLFVIQESDGEREEANNPLKMSSEDSTVGDFIPWFTFPDMDEACSSMGMPTSAILWNEVRKERSKPGANGVALYVKLSDKVQVLYVAGKLTVSKVVGNGDTMTKTARIKSTDPHEFFDPLNLSDKEKELCGSLLAMCEMGSIMEKDMPDTYRLILERTRKEFGVDE